MCKCSIPIKAKNPYNITRAYVPCGRCEECRLMKKTEWTNRLLIEMDYYQKKFGYKVGFITLTYDEEHLPHIPKKFLKDENEKIPCFNYEHVKKLNGTLRKYLWSKHGMKNGYRYFITCEYGEKHHRPHMHGIILFNPKFTHEEFYRFIQDAWTGTTYYIQNNEKRKTERENFGMINSLEDFIPIDTHKCGAYVAKYVCKDIEYEEYTEPKIKDNLTGKERNELRHYEPFHKQSLGLSKCMLDENKLKLLEQLKNGVSVLGSAKNKELPNYIKEKINYTQHKTYNLKLHRFEQTKIYTQTYYENKKQVYTKKYEQNKKLFERLQTNEYWELKQKETGVKLNAVRDIKAITQEIPTEELAKFYTTYYGLDYDKCVIDKPEEILFSRYNPIADQTNKELIDKGYYMQMCDACSIIIGYAQINTRNKRSQKQEITDKIKSFWTNLKIENNITRSKNAFSKTQR